MKTNSLTLVIMAAGRGRRFGSLKQLAGFGPHGETLMDYSLHDALRAGIDRAVLVISPRLEPEFRARLGEPWRERLEVRLVSQEMDDLPVLPVGGAGPAARLKPWGTGQALWAARTEVDGPFIVCNADDFYGRDAFGSLAGFLDAGHGPDSFAMPGFDLLDTLPPEGAFSRGFCRVSADGLLEEIQERHGVRRADVTGPGQVVSMNIWGFTPAVFPLLEDLFRRFLVDIGHDPEQEFYLPSAVQQAVAAGRCRVRVLPGAGSWFGVTNPQDADLVRDRLARLHVQGVYPEDLRA